MHKFKNLVIGGIENKVFNLILVAMLVVAAAFMLVTQHQADTLYRLQNERNGLVKVDVNKVCHLSFKSLIADSAQAFSSSSAKKLNDGYLTVS